MDIKKAHSMAEFLIAKHLGDSGWTVRWERSSDRAGACYYDKREIVLSENAIMGYKPEEVEQVVVHEIAHAQMGPAHGHDNAWLHAARNLGYTGDEFAPAPVVDPSNSVLRLMFIFFVACVIIPTPITWAIAAVLSAILVIMWIAYKSAPVYTPDVDYFGETA